MERKFQVDALTIERVACFIVLGGALLAAIALYVENTTMFLIGLVFAACASSFVRDPNVVMAEKHLRETSSSISSLSRDLAELEAEAEALREKIAEVNRRHGGR